MACRMRHWTQLIEAWRESDGPTGKFGVRDGEVFKVR